jgi:nitrate/TMAO reductase-like tetraheme cytochrome c subunit
MDDEAEPDTDTESGNKAKAPSLARNFISLFGASVAAASLLAIFFLIFIELSEAADKPYLGIFTYIIFPAVMILGLLVVLAGMLIERRRRRRLAPGEIKAYPVLDLNDPRRRRSLFVFIVATFIFVLLSAYGSYRAYEYTETVAFCGVTCHSVMKPEYVAYQASPHARVRCVDCHVGPGAGWYVRSKLSGAYQVYSVWFNKYPRPIKSPVHSLRPAQDTCEQCHWPEKFFGAQLKVFNRYAYDEGNSLSQTRMLINTGGGSPVTGQVAGIHWHMNIANEITYVARDEQRQEVQWVRVKDREGKVTEYFGPGERLSPQQIEAAAKRRMDCVDCHNRPAHIYLPPDTAVDQALAAGRLDAGLPFIKRQAVEVLSKPYSSEDEAVNAIASELDDYYRTSHAGLHAEKAGAIKSAVAEVQRIYQTYIFPEMKTDWRTHPNNIGHYYFAGCFRCHDGRHTSAAGQVIRNDCNICHTVLDQSVGGNALTVRGGAFQHPVDLGDLAKYNCTHCHTGDHSFRHPVNLGDISQFKCADCHSGKVWTEDR